MKYPKKRTAKQTDTERTCSGCNQTKHIEQFPKYKSLTGVFHRRYKCRECHYKEYPYSRVEYQQWKTKYFKKFAWKVHYHTVKARAKKLKLEFNLTEEDFKNAPSVCPILKIPISYRNKDKSYNKSCDRIDNTRGYTRDNIVFISMKANACKNNLTFEQLENMYFFYKTLLNK